ncbi:S-adenosylmethionine decarboxylase family protein [Arsenicibacter rosenii]|uniref:S-adenosylmethionine decarboxylase n=1 Tax=Arsenicibacter rosenii TaxID=1750698 RepID=A0A1S2VLQ5_9BACT|nr:S-adenosylmethionine decarboxylase [Arsenicibacter rosenii]OIN59707.1 S-adenosylmethionine decarboxylase [Arsenicibacter rosenii]
MKSYDPGLHILATFSTAAEQLTDVSGCQAFFNQLIDELKLCKVGEVYHTFPNQSFTAVIGLTESHLSIHTWPEHGLATFDVFLSNFQHDNSGKVRRIYAETLAFFNATAVHVQEVSR